MERNELREEYGGLTGKGTIELDSENKPHYTSEYVEWLQDKILQGQELPLVDVSESLLSDVDIESESEYRQLEGAEPFSFTAGAKWAISKVIK